MLISYIGLHSAKILGDSTVGDLECPQPKLLQWPRSPIGLYGRPLYMYVCLSILPLATLCHIRVYTAQPPLPAVLRGPR